MATGTDGSGESDGDDGGFGVVSALFGSKLRIAGIALLSLVLALVVVAGVLGVGLPTLDGVDNRFGDVNESETVVVSDLHVSNPNPIGSKFLDASAEYTVSMNGIEMASGHKDEISTPPGNSTVTMRTGLQNEKIPAWWVSHLQNGEQTDVEIEASIDSGLIGRSFPVTNQQTVQTDILSSFNSTETREVNANRAFVSDPVLYVNETAGQWGNVTSEETPIVLDFYLYNPKPYPIPVSKIEYDITMNNVSVGNGTNTREYVLQSGQVTKVTTVTRIDNDKLDEWWVTHIERNQTTDLKIDFDATLDVSGTSVRVPMDKFTYEETIETDIFGNKANATGNGSAGTGEGTTTTEEGAGSTDDGGAGSTDDGGAGSTTDGDDGTSTDSSDGSSGTDGGTTTAGQSTTTGSTTTSEPTTTAGDGGEGSTTTTDDGLLDSGLLAIRATGDTFNFRALTAMST
ncbi:LEA type 2 family protein [Haloarchaeobius sp. TZWWS8]|uniref:LEA type 2 family protein n=1 Tax=Haloarchaeobius sp. TZWWS8 TaxID=3446121 RepID=UPI003EBCF077